MRYQFILLGVLAALVGVFAISNQTLAADAKSLQSTGTTSVTGNTNRVVVSSDYIYVSTSQGIAVLNRWTHALAKFISLPVDAFGMSLELPYLYVANGSYGIRIYDLTDPANPVLANTINTGGYAYDVSTQVSPYLISVNSVEGAMQIYSLTSKTAPVLQSNVTLGSPAKYFAIKSPHAYIATTAGLKVVSIGATPAVVATLDTPGTAYDVDTDNLRYVYVADDGYMTVVDAAAPSAPVVAGYYKGTTGIVSVDLVRTIPSGPLSSLRGTFVAIGRSSYGMQLLDVSVPARPSFFAHYETSGVVSDVEAATELVIADGPTGLAFVDYERAVTTVVTPLTLVDYGYRIPGGEAIVPFRAGQKMAGWRINTCLESSDTTCSAYMFALLNPSKPVTLKLYSSVGKLIKTTSPFSRGTNGANIRFMHHPLSDRTLVAVAPKAGPVMTQVYRLTKTDLVRAGTLNVGPSNKTGNTLVAFLRLGQDREDALVTGIAGSTLPVKFWRYNSFNNSFSQDKSSYLTNLITKTTSRITAK